MESFLAQWNLTPLNTEGELCTYKTGRRDIDVTVADYSLACKVTSWRVLNRVPHTDHRPIVISLGDLSRVDRVTQMRYNVAKADWDLFSKEVGRMVGRSEWCDRTLNCAEDV